MTQVGEPVSVGIVIDETPACPFDHQVDDPDTLDVQNELVGVGSKLDSNMTKRTPQGTHLYEPKVRSDLKPLTNPGDDPKHEFCKDNASEGKPVVIKYQRDDPYGEGRVITAMYKLPVTCAAHHLVPAQESLKRSKLLEFMAKEGETPGVKGSTSIKGKVWAKVGYNVNGLENGVFLPGPYAVGGGTAGLDIWSGGGTASDQIVKAALDLALQPDDEDETPPPTSITIEVPPEALKGPTAKVPDSKQRSRILGAERAGGLSAHQQMTNNLAAVFSDSNRKWQYVRQAMEKCPGQFHDRHVDYSNFVLEALDKIHASYVAMKKSNIDPLPDGGDCSQCKDRADKIKQQQDNQKGLPTPFELVDRLNSLSSSLSGYLTNSTWPINIYTSKWCRAYMEYLRTQG